jgi:DNA-binding response OmpR family regulator
MARILLIDDDDLVRDSLAIALNLAGHDVSSARNGRDGWKMFSDDRPDIVVTDIIMPEQEGIETIMAMRKVDKVIPIIAMSGGSSIGSATFLDAAQSFGATRVLRKPFGPKELLAAIDACLR